MELIALRQGIQSLKHLVLIAGGVVDPGIQRAIQDFKEIFESHGLDSNPCVEERS